MEKVREKSGGSEIKIFSLIFTKYRLAAGLCPGALPGPAGGAVTTPNVK